METQNEGLIISECSFSATSTQKQKPAVFTERKVERQKEESKTNRKKDFLQKVTERKTK